MKLSIDSRISTEEKARVDKDLAEVIRHYQDDNIGLRREAFGHPKAEADRRYESHTVRAMLDLPLLVRRRIRRLAMGPLQALFPQSASPPPGPRSVRPGLFLSQLVLLSCACREPPDPLATALPPKLIPANGAGASVGAIQPR